MIRSFAGISLPDPVSDSLMDVQDRVRNARWIDADNLHLTLAFLGECSREQLTELDSGLGAIAMEAFELRVSGVGAFGGGRPHVLYAALAESEPLRRLAGKIERLARQADIALERRKFHPHITLARCGGGVIPAQAVGWTHTHARLKTDPFTVHGFTLFRSDLGTGAPIYTPMVEYPLRRGEGSDR